MHLTDLLDFMKKKIDICDMQQDLHCPTCGCSM